MAEIQLAADSRNEFGKGAARRIRRADKVPAVLYGHGTDPVHITLPGHETLLALRAANALLSISIDGAESQLALPKQVQRDPIKGSIKHVDLLIVKRGEKVTVEVPIVVAGEAGPDTIVVSEATALTIEAEATHIPGEITVSVEGLEAGSQIALGDIKLPHGVDLVGDPEALAVVIANAPTEAELEAELEVPEGEGHVDAENGTQDEASDDEGDTHSGEKGDVGTEGKNEDKDKPRG